jgi:hypothetical protein
MMHFVPGTFEQPENLSEGSKLFLEIMKEVTGVDMKPIQLVSAENVLKGNTECEEKLKKTIQSRVGTQEAVTLDIATLEDFEKPAAALLEAFVSARKFDDATKKWWVPSKGTAGNVRDPSKQCKKTKGPFLLEIAYEMRASPVIATVPDRPAITIPVMQIRPPSVIRFENSELLDDFAATEDWCTNAYFAIKSIENLGVACLDKNLETIAQTRATSRLMARKLLARLPMYLASKIPPEKEHLLPGQHWVWTSLCGKLTRVCTLMHLSGHIAQDLETRGPDEGFLALPNEFQQVV